MNDKYILKNKKIIKADLMTWLKWFENSKDRIIKQETLPNGYFVSNVFLGIDYNFSFNPKAKPILFETMVFKDKKSFSELDINRYSTYKEAVKGHKLMVLIWTSKQEKR